MKIKKKVVVLVIIIFMIGVPIVGSASSQFHFDKQDEKLNKEILIDSNTKINDDVFEFIDIIKNRGIIVGDLFVIGKEVWNYGTVIGDILGANQITNISGISKGNVRVVTNRLDITGEVYRNVSAIAKDLTLHESGVIDGSVTIIGDKVEVNGLVSSDIRGKINTLIIAGEVKGDVDVEVAKIQFGQNGKIHGDLNYKSSNEILMPESKVNGDITYSKKASVTEECNVDKNITFLQAIKYLLDFLVMLFKCI